MWKPVPPPFQDFKKDVFAKASLTADLIYQVGEHDALRKPSHEVSLQEVTSEETQNKFAYIITCLTMYRERTGYGRGITAVQIGLSERFSVIYTPEKYLIIVNPRVTKKSEKKLLYPEMCMSAFPVIAPVVRPAWIEFEYYDESGEKHFWDTKDDSDDGKIMNRVFQHEIDHMDGIINIDIVESSKELILESDPEFYKNAAFKEI
jgi:peptide deformylase